MASKQTYCMDMYNTVWLSDYESNKSYGSRSGFSSLSHSKIDSFLDNVYHSSPKMFANHNSSPKMFANDIFRQNGWCKSCLSRKSSLKNYIHRTYSLPDLEFANIKASNLQDRFSHLQLEQENKELRLLVDQLQDALETIEETMKLDFKSGQKRSSYPSFNPNSTIDFKRSSQDLIDSLDGSIELYKSSGEKVIKMRDRNESGYCTSRHDSYGTMTYKGVDDENGEHALNRSHYSEYSDRDSSNDDSNFYESRLVKKRTGADDGPSCCLVN